MDTGLPGPSQASETDRRRGRGRGGGRGRGRVESVADSDEIGKACHKGAIVLILCYY